ncbi:hypothetical protein [Pararobbsia silviterrae]|uniref:Terminase small subunit n=1 Tax=Pararobbsia silviterrae TaxID=1792498 RepID=A0A494X7W1_9BURK|nr:hypothetical protein [Pararobbsia silviterrae]RKP43803.1 hypothetical protein D7S86_28460 [Pararobbsia silviterrae]
MAEVSQRAFARHMGVALNAVQKAIKAGRISLTSTGKIDVDAAERAWRRNTDESRRSFEDLSRPSRALSSTATSSPPADPDDDDLPPAGAGEDPHMAAYRAARAAREQTRLERERMELERDRGNTLSLADAQRMAFTAFRTVRDNVMNVPVRVKDSLAAEADPSRVEAMLEEELARALSSIDAATLMRDSDEEENDGGDRFVSEDDYGGDST